MGNSASLLRSLATWKEESGDQIDCLEISPCAPAEVLHPPLRTGHTASACSFLSGAAWSQLQSQCELCVGAQLMGGEHKLNNKCSL